MNFFSHYLLYFPLLTIFLGAGTPTKPDSLVSVLEKAGMDTTRVKLLNDLGAELISKGEYRAAMEYLLQSKTLAEKLGYKKGIANACNKIGTAYWFRGDYEKAMQNFLTALNSWEETNDKKGIANTNTNIGMIYATQGNYKKALEKYASSLQAAESIGDKKAMAKAYNNMGEVCSRQGLASVTNAVKTNKYKQALENHIKSLHLMEEIGDKQGEAHALINIGNSYYNIGNVMSKKQDAFTWYEKDLAVQFKALKIKEETGDKQGMAICYSSIGIVYDMKENTERSKHYIEKALVLYKEIGYKTGIKESYSYLGQLAEEKGDYKKALEYHKFSADLKDSLLNEKSGDQIAEMAAKYQSEKKQKENEVLEQKNRMQDYKIKQSHYFIFGLSILSVLIVAIAFLLIRQNKINASKAKIEMEQKLLRSQMNPHFIFNAMVGIQNYIYREEPEIAANYLSSVVQLMRSIIDNSQKEYVTLEKEIAALHHYLTLQKVRFQDKFDFTIETDPGIDIETIRIPPMMAQPFIENAIIHGVMRKTGDQGIITVRLALRSNYLSLEIEDNGIGREKAKEFSTKESTHLSIATNITEERLAILNKGSKNKNSMQITDLKNELGLPAGTRVTFLFATGK